MKLLLKEIRVLLLFICALLGAGACFDSGNVKSEDAGLGPADADTLVDAGDSSDAGLPDSGGEQDAGPSSDACVPTVTECSEDVCGQVDNGCGEMLDCEPCRCQNGIAQESDCGACGLGTLTCGSGETGPGTCEVPEILGVSAEADDTICRAKLVFVDANAEAGGDGSRETPFTSYGEAVDSAVAGQTVILGGQTTLEEKLRVKRGVSVIGGFSGAPEFSWREDARTTFQVAAPDGAAVFGIEARGIDEETRLTNIRVTTADASSGRTNYGAYVVDSPNLTMTRVVVRAGAGGNGAPGSDGQKGADGSPGENSMLPNPDPNSAQARGMGASGGTNAACPEANGGQGGEGGRHVITIVEPPTDGLDSEAGAAGGTAGKGGFSSSDNGGGNGANGVVPGNLGDNGAAGESGGTVEGDLWVADGAGGAGGRGPHGPGGGGGGGSWYGADVDSTGIHYDGPEGAGGGAGGCGGHGGTGGQPGAGSFGLFVVRSPINIIASSFHAGGGGIGGDGGRGGLGGSGATGGQGTRETRTPLKVSGRVHYKTLSWSSGDGGDGAAGQAGGAGGGGAGGVSYGVYCVESQPTIDQATEMAAGESAPGGQSPVYPGGAGLTADSHGCD